jgi:hypothetical protein
MRFDGKGATWFLHCEAGEGDRRSRWRERVTGATVAAPSTALRAVPLPRRRRQGRNPHDAQSDHHA